MRLRQDKSPDQLYPGRWFLLAAFCLLQACSSVPARKADPAAELAYKQREQMLAGPVHWRLVGKLGASDGKDGGSGSFSWESDDDRTRMSFRGALGKGAWELEAGSDVALLRFADGREYRAGSVAELVNAHMRAKVPVDALAWWVLGLAQPTDWKERELDAEGRITFLKQSGWDVNFSAYRQEQDVWLPGKLVARKQQQSVKLAISDWMLDRQVATFD